MSMYNVQDAFVLLALFRTLLLNQQPISNSLYYQVFLTTQHVFLAITACELWEQPFYTF